MYLVLVDDDEQIIRALEREVKIGYGADDFDVLSFTDPEKGLEFIRENKGNVFCIIGDMRMPKIDGAQLFKAAREADANTSFILLSGYSDVEDIRRAVSTSIQSFLVKPWKQEELFLEIRKARDLWMLRQENITLKSELDTQLETAAEFQQVLMASGKLSVPGLEIGITNTPFGTIRCGGDYYEIIPLDDGGVTVLLGDVSGHGLRSAFVTIMLKTLVQNLQLHEKDVLSQPDLLLARLNVELYKLLKDTPVMFAAMCALTLKPGFREGLLANAGQLPIFQITENEVQPVIAEGIVLGIGTNTKYVMTPVTLSKGDRIVLITDGLCESVKSHTKLHVLQIIRVLEKTRALSSDEVHESFKPLLPDETFSDDATVIVIDIQE